MNVRCLFFARLRDTAGQSEAVWSLAPGSTVASLWDAAPSKRAGLDAYRDFTRIAVNGSLAADHQILGEGDEVAFLPPVSGG